MAHKTGVGKEEKKIKPVLPGTPEMITLLQGGYGDMTVEKANTIIAERKANPQSWPYTEFERANAFLAAYNTPSRPVAKNQGWKREKV